MYIKLMVIIVLFSFSHICSAARYDSKGYVADILLRTGSDYYAVLYVDGFTSAGSCPTFQDHVIVIIPDDEKAEARYSMLLSLFMANKKVHFRVDDTKKNSSGQCVIVDLRLDKNF